MKLQLSEIAQAVNGKLIGEDRLILSTGIDTRTLPAGALYIAIKGKHFDGHSFIENAEQAGAAALLIEQAAP
jgi:UDP-N-acetylmuramoyl-tripeptide--D-alanyl-D-alanine ligase